MTPPPPSNTTPATTDPFKARQTIDTPLGKRAIHDLNALRGVSEMHRLPYSIKVLLEAVLRHVDGHVVSEDHAKALARYGKQDVGKIEIPFMPGRVVLQDFTGVPAVVDLAAMRDGIVRLTGNEADAKKVNPQVPCDLVIDHSVQVDAFGSNTALTVNSQKEFDRNNERYRFLKWGQQAFDNFRVVPPATGIVHQVNLEYLAKVVWDEEQGTKARSHEGTQDGVDHVPSLYPDSLVGTDSHTTMINGLGVVGWGVGGIEAEAVMMGQPIYMLIPEVVGVRFTGVLNEGVTATDLVLHVTELLRDHGVVGKFVEFHGPGLASMPLANRATIANMAPEYGATMGFFPVDEKTTEYLELTGRSREHIETVEQYARLQGLWRDDDYQIDYSEELHLDLGDVEPSLAGPKRPQDRIGLSAMKSQWQQDLTTTYGKEATCSPHDSTPDNMIDEGGPSSKSGGTYQGPATAATADPASAQANDAATLTFNGQTFTLRDGDVAIAAITSCTNTSNPGVMLAAGLVARKARALGLNSKPWVKTSTAPGSKVVTEYYRKANLWEDLEALGFHLVGYGCTTCIGNSGPLPEPISQAIKDNDLVCASVLSGNRNFEGRVSPDTRANYLASPPLVVAYAIAGTVNIDLQNEPIAQSSQGKDVYLRDIWPSQQEIEDLTQQCVNREEFTEQYADVFHGSDEWRQIDAPSGVLYQWNEDSTYIQNPPFFTEMQTQPPKVQSIEGGRCLAKLGDSVTTDHISPAGSIAKASPAGRYLQDKGVSVSMFNSYGSRRGNDRVMTRGTFANIRVRNQLASGTEGGFTTFFGTRAGPAKASQPAPDSNQGHSPSTGPEAEVKPGEITSIFDAAVAYGSAKTSDPELCGPVTGPPLVILAGNDYGMGSSRDWAAKGAFLLGVRAVIAASYERIHRSNLVGMGVLPLQFETGQTHESLGLTGEEIFAIDLIDDLKPRQQIEVTAAPPEGSSDPIRFNTVCRIDTPVEIDYYKNAGILHTVLRRMAQ